MIIFVYGYEGSGPGHWQRWLAQTLEERGEDVAFPELPDPLEPQKDAWVAELQRVRESASSPIIFVCHSLGCWAVDHLLAETGSDGVHGALLVAPPSPHLIFEAVDSFLPPPRSAQVWAPLASHSLVVGSDNDDFASREEFEEIAQTLGLPFHFIPDAGHINTASGYGEWSWALDWVAKHGISYRSDHKS